MLPQVHAPGVLLELRNERVLLDERLGHGALAQVAATLPTWLPGLHGLHRFVQGVECKRLAFG